MNSKMFRVRQTKEFATGWAFLAALVLALVVFMEYYPLSSPVQAAVFPGWDQINTIYYSAAEDDPSNGYLAKAATALKTELEPVAGKSFTIVSSGIPPATGIFLKKDSSLPEFATRNSEAFKLFTDAAGIHITGNSTLAVRHGAYTLLEKLGYRWFFKNPVWYVKPASLSSLTLNEVQEPTFLYRSLWYYDVPGERQKLGAWARANKYPGAIWFSDRHSYDAIISRAEAASLGVNCDLQLDPLNETVFQRAVSYARNLLSEPKANDVEGLTGDIVPVGAASIEPNDNANWCATYKNADNSLNIPKISTDTFTLTNKVAAALKAEFPGKYISQLSYSRHSGLPDVVFENNVLAFVVTHVFVHSGVPYAARLQHFKDRGAQVGAYTYVGRDQRDTAFHANNIKTLASYGGIAYFAEGRSQWGERGFLYYVLSKLMWDPSLDVASIKQDFYDKAFGPAAVPMERFFTRHDTESYKNRRVIALAFNDLAEAESLAVGNQEVLDRIRHMEYWLRYTWQSEFGEAYNTSIAAEATAWNDFKCSLYNTSLLWTWWQLGGCNPSTPPPTAAQAEQWLDQAIAALADETFVDVIAFPLVLSDLVPLDQTGLTTYSPQIFAASTQLIQFTAEDITALGGTFPLTVTLSETSGSHIPSISWTDPNGNVPFSQQYAAGFKGTVTLNLPVSTPGVYKLSYDTNFGGGAYFTLGSFGDRPAAISTGYIQKRYALSGYFYVPNDTTGFILNTTLAWTTKTGNLKLIRPDGSVAYDQPFGTAEVIMNAPMPGLWKMEIPHEGKATISLKGVPPLLWYDAKNLLVPASVISTFSLSSLPRHHLFQGENNTFEVKGTAFNTSTTYTIKFLQGGALRKSISLTPTDTTTLRTTLSSPDLSPLTPGLYDLVVERTSDGTAKTYATKLAITKRGDLWSSTAIDTTTQKRDGKVDIHDVSRLLSKWGTADTDADINPGPSNVSQGSVDIYDLNLMMKNWTG